MSTIIADSLLKIKIEKNLLKRKYERKSLRKYKKGNMSGEVCDIYIVLCKFIKIFFWKFHFRYNYIFINGRFFKFMIYKMKMLVIYIARLWLMYWYQNLFNLSQFLLKIQKIKYVRSKINVSNNLKNPCIIMISCFMNQ